MKIATAQINTTIGDFPGNSRLIVEAAATAAARGARLVVFPELALCGYPPMDLLDHAAFVEENIRALRDLQQTLPREIMVVVGYVDRSPDHRGRSLRNVAAVLHNGGVIFRQAKRLLPTYDVFDEARYFEPDHQSRVWEVDGVPAGIAICEDIWWETEPVPGARYPVDPVRDLVDAGARLVISPSASPFHRGKPAIRQTLLESIGRNSGVPVVYVNAVGGNDSLIFDGASMVTDRRGTVIHRSPGFVEDLAVVDVETAAEAARGAPPAESVPRAGITTGAPETAAPSPRAALPDRQNCQDSQDHWQTIEDALVLGVRDYLRKTGFTRVHFGLSGGIDSAVVAVIAARAVGPGNVTAFLLPSQYSSGGSITDSLQLAENLRISTETLEIEPVYRAFEGTLAPLFSGMAPDITEENLQARIRGTLLMAWSNKTGSLTLTTGNKSELAVGYCTLYGDMCGGLAVIGDLLKTEVYALARHINRQGEVIPEAIITKAPSAELRPDQRDDDSLPPYPVLDRILSEYLIGNRTFSRIVEGGGTGDAPQEPLDSETVSRVLALVGRSEYKRRQAPPVLKVSPRAFGTGRRMPVARRIYETRR